MSSTVHAGRHRAAEAHLPPPPHPSVRRTPARRALALLSDLALVGCLLVFALLAIGPHVLGYRTSTMLTGSMEPGISPGDVVVTMPKPVADVEVGDVLSYHIPIEDHRVETHRVIEVLHHRDGTVAIRTQGDNNAEPDPWTATLQGDEVWEKRAVVPELGTVIRVLRAPAFEHGVFWAALGGLLLLGLGTIWTKDHDGDAQTEQEDGHDE